jgi:transcriptional regulator with XRE-family HTH domain
MSDKEFLIQMGLRIKAIRNKRKVTVRKLSELTGYGHAALSRIENGQYRSRVTTLKKIAEVLEVDIKYFFNFA